MEKTEGLVHDFLAAKMVNLITYAEDGAAKSRPMTNFNEDPYNTMWFPTYSGTEKVRDIERNPEVALRFPSSKEGEFWEIRGVASFEGDGEVSEKWQWWYIYWHPDAETHGWGVKGDASFVDHRKIIDIDPVSVRLVDAP